MAGVSGRFRLWHFPGVFILSGRFGPGDYWAIPGRCRRLMGAADQDQENKGRQVSGGRALVC